MRRRAIGLLVIALLTCLFGVSVRLGLIDFDPQIFLVVFLGAIPFALFFSWMTRTHNRLAHRVVGILEVIWDVGVGIFAIYFLMNVAPSAFDLNIHFDFWASITLIFVAVLGGAYIYLGYRNAVRLANNWKDPARAA